MRNKNEAGQLTLYVMVFSAVSLIILSGFILWADANIRGVFRDSDRAQAFMASEAGIEYYRWHLQHAPHDYQDGTAQSGPYLHQFNDKDGNAIGAFSLAITPPLTGSSVVTVDSTGTLDANPSVARTIESKMAIPSFVRFAAVSATGIRFSEGTELYGATHSNGGIRLDGVAHNLVTSSVATYNDPSHGGGSTEFGIHTHVAPVDPTPPASVPNRPDVFMAGRQFPVAPVDFVGITQDLQGLKASAQADGFYHGPPANKDVGYHIVVKINDTFDLYTVNSTVKPPGGCVTVLGEKDWDTWTIDKETKIATYAFPHNGIIFIEGNVWIDGQINTARLTIGAAVFPENSSKYAHITVNKDLKYTNYDGQDILGLIAQGNVNVGWNSQDTLRIDGAIMAQNGRIGRYYYKGPEGGNQDRCAPYHIRNQITLFGTIGSNGEYGFRFSDGTGYQHIIIIFDPNLMFAPPPDYPLSSTYYTSVFWLEK
jgi:hypothetical protein